MHYDFSTTLHDTDEELKDFIHIYTACVDTGHEKEIKTVSGLYEKIFEMFKHGFDSPEIVLLFEELANFKLANGIPHSIMSNEISELKSLLIENIYGEKSNIDIRQVLQLFKEINNRVSYIYLLQYIELLISSNNIRLSSISDLVEKNIIIYYEAHLEWLIELAQHIKTASKESFPQLDAKLCNFGVWLHSDGKALIQNNSKFLNLEKIHKSLHLFAQKIYNILDKGEYHIIITYLEKCELISLGIGTELALLDHMLMNKTVTKDTMTGALNRNALRSVFQSQYELSLATNNPFILAMCDLDFFKKVNDTYGHVAGDKLLKIFVDVVKKNIRNSDVVVRFGGEEFIIMLPTIHKDKGFEILDKIRSDFSQTVLEFNNEKITATVSVGMMEIEPEYLFQKSFTDKYLMIVDQRLYLAKESGRNRVEHS